MVPTIIALALAAAGAGLSDDTRLYCVGSDQKLQNIKTLDDFDAASPNMINADLGALEAAMLQHLGLRGSIGVTGERTGLLTFREPARSTETITYSIRREDDGIALRLGRKLNWDAAKEEFSDDREANGFLAREMRKPWNYDRI